MMLISQSTNYFKPFFFEVIQTCFLVTLNENMAKPDSQEYSWNLYLIKNVEDIDIFLGLKMFSSCVFSGSMEMCKSFLQRSK